VAVALMCMIVNKILTHIEKTLNENGSSPKQTLLAKIEKKP
jgi:hypothetical protein